MMSDQDDCWLTEKEPELGTKSLKTSDFQLHNPARTNPWPLGYDETH
jgi:hypothetical protein